MTAKIYIGLAIVALITVLGWSAKHYYTKSVLQEVKVEALTQVVKDDKKESDLKDNSDKIGDKSVSNAKDATDKLEEDNRTIEKKQEMTEAAIQHRFVDNSKNVKSPEAIGELITARDKAISSSRIDSLWETYCLGPDNATTCAQQKPSVQESDHA